jgi:hypothetical protein
MRMFQFAVYFTTIMTREYALSPVVWRYVYTPGLTVAALNETDCVPDCALSSNNVATNLQKRY